MKSQFRAVNRFISKIKSTSSIDGISNSGTFQVEDTTVAGFSLPQGAVTFYVTADFAQTGKEEIFRIVNVAGDVLTYDKRIPVGGYVKPAHAAGASIRINDVADIINEMSENIDNFGKVSPIAGTQTVKVWGGIFNNNGTIYNVATATLAVAGGQLVDNSTNYIHFVLSTQLFTVTASSTFSGAVCMASVVVSGGVIGTIADLRPGFATTYGEITTKLDKTGGLREGFGANKHIVLNRTTGLEESKNVTDSAGVISTDKIRIQKVSGDFEDATMSQLQGAIAGLTSEYILCGSVASNESVYFSNLKKYRNATTPLAAIGQTVAKTTFRMYSSGNSEQRFIFYFTKTGTPQDLTFRIETDDGSGNASGTLVNANAVLVTAIASITSNEIYEIVLPASFNLGAAGTPIHFVFWQGSQYVNASNYLSIGIEDEVCIAHDKVTNTGANQSATRTIWSTTGTLTNPVCSQIIDCIADVQLVSLGFSDSISLLEIYNVTDGNTLLYRNPTTRSGYTLPEPVQLKSGKRYNIAYTAVGTISNVTVYTSQVNSSQIQWVSGGDGGGLVNIVTRTATFTQNAAILSQYISKAIATTAIKAAVYALVPSASSPGSYPSIKKDGYLTGFSSLVKGATYYLSNTGVISTTAGTVSKVIGVAINSTTIRVDSAISTS